MFDHILKLCDMSHPLWSMSDRRGSRWEPRGCWGLQMETPSMGRFLVGVPGDGRFLDRTTEEDTLRKVKYETVRKRFLLLSFPKRGV